MPDKSSAFELAGQVAVVTGASSGIGRAIALELAAAGADVLVHAAQNRKGAEETAAEVRRLGRQAEIVVADFTKPEAIEALAKNAWQWQQGVDVWVNNAGVDVLTGPTAKWSFEKKLEYLWQVDVLGTVRLSRSIGDQMRKRGRGGIINVGWDQAETGMAGDTAELFAATKGAIMAFTRSLAQSLAPQVRVNCLAPGWIKTAWGERASESWQDRAKDESLLAQWGAPEDVARAARFLASTAAEFINGQVIAVNGGRRFAQWPRQEN